MQDQGKRLLIFAVFSMALMFAWQTFFPPKKPAAKQAEATGPAAALTLSSMSNESPVEPSLPRGAAAPSPDDILFAFPNLRARFSAQGGVAAEWHLTDAKYAADATHGNMAVGPFLAVNFAQGTTPETFAIPADATWTGERVGDTGVKYTWADANLQVTKTYRIDAANYLLHLTVDAKRLGPPTPAALVVSTFAREPAENWLPGAKPGEKGRTQATSDWEGLCLGGEKPRHHKWKDLITTSRSEKAVASGGVGSSYIVAVVAPKRAANETVACQTSVRPLASQLQNDLIFPSVLMAEGSSQTRELVAFMGPKHYDSLKRLDETVGYTTGLDALVDFGWFGFIGRPLLGILKFFHTHTGNWGIAIILLTVLVKLVTLPWTTKSMRSMKAMAALAPKMKEIQEKYPDNREKQQVELAALYKDNNISPVAGCLPMFLQMPIWLALYRMLSSAGEMYLEGFAWIKDLTIADPMYILPVVLLVTMLAQAKLQPQTQTGLQQKIIMYGLPIGFGIAAFVFPAGLSLYMLTNTVLSATHSIYMNKFDHGAKPPVATGPGGVIDTTATTNPTTGATNALVSTTTPAPAKNGARKKATKQPRGQR